MFSVMTGFFDLACFHGVGYSFAPFYNQSFTVWVPPRLAYPPVCGWTLGFSPMSAVTNGALRDSGAWACADKCAR